MERECTRDALPLGQSLADVERQLPAGVRRNAYVERAVETLTALDIEETLRQIKALNAGLVGKPYLHAVSGDSSRVVPYEEVIAAVGTFPARIGALYLHFPYCTKKCRFCHYYTDSSGTEEDWREFPRYLVEEMGLLQRAYGIEGRIAADTIHFGGGTPSLIGPRCVRSGDRNRGGNGPGGCVVRAGGRLVPDRRHPGEHRHSVVRRRRLTLHAAPP